MEKINSAMRIYREYGLRQLIRETNSFIFRELSSAQDYLYNKYWERMNGTGVSITDKDWDNIIILDACRYDEFVSQNPFDVEVEKRISLGSNTSEFLRRNFLGKELYDTVYLTANPKGVKLESGDYGSDRIFHSIIPLLDDWDPDTHTVMPETVRNRAVEAQNEFPEKKLLIHFVQPHMPFIGKTARKIQSEHQVSVGGWETTGRSYIKSNKSINKDRITFDEITDEKYDVTSEDFLKMYRETLTETLPSVKKLVNELEGKTVVTSDHGEMFGNKPHWLSEPIYGHPQGKRTDELCIVPWVEIEATERKLVKSDPPIKKDDICENKVEDRLNALGYK